MNTPQAVHLQSYTSRQAAEFQRIFKRSIKEFWCGPLLGFDILKFDDEVLKSGTQPPRAAIFQTYGTDAVKLIESLLGMPVTGEVSK